MLSVDYKIQLKFDKKCMYIILEIYIYKKDWIL